jgi:predicted enzyme related to lactoylglutathione lyase
MSVQIRAITFDCADPERLAAFWSAALGFTKREVPAGFATWAEYLASQGIPEGQWSTSAAVMDPEGKCPRLLFLKVPEGKTVKNRVHLDLSPDGTMAEEVSRMVTLGARVERIFDDQADVFTVMQDPEGNEFCVERGASE